MATGDRPHLDPRKLTRWYDAQAPLYRAWRHRSARALARRAVAALGADRAAPLRILDVGCGAGLFAVEAARAFPAASVTGVDASAGMLAVAGRESRSHGVDARVGLAVADAARLPFGDGAFDAVVAAGLLPNVNDADAVLAELGRVVARGGRLLVVECDRAGLGPAGRVAFHVLIFAQRAVSTLLRRYRFADRWDLDASTIDSADLEARLRRAGLEVRQLSRDSGHLVYRIERPGPTGGAGVPGGPAVPGLP